MEAVQKCKAAWVNASTDTEKFAALFVVIKVLKSSELTADQCREIFETIGFSFLRRLLESDVPHGCPPSILKAVALSILTCFTVYPELCADSRLGNFIAPLKNILDENLMATDDETLIADILSIFGAMAHQEKYQQKMIEEGVFTLVANLYLSGARNSSQAHKVVMLIMLQGDVSHSLCNAYGFGEVLNKMCTDFYTENTEKKFELCEQILLILVKFPCFQLDETLACAIRAALTDILQSKLGKQQRDVGIKLASIMVDKFCAQWFIDEDDSREFFVILVQLICVEVRMLLEEKSVDDLSGDAFLLTACYGILEAVISVMVNENWFQSNRNYASQLLDSLKMAMAAVIDFLKQLSVCPQPLNFKLCFNTEKFNSEQIILATIRVLCSWLAEETFILQEEVREVIPYLLNVCKQFFIQKKYIESDFELDPWRFMIPPLCHLTADDQSRKILLDNDFVSLLFAYMDNTWHRYLRSKSSNSEALIITICGIYLNVVVFESRVIAEYEGFFPLLKLLLNALPALPAGLEHLTLKANFSVLGLLITRHCHKKVKSCETSFYRFLSSSIKFLWDAHHVEVENITRLIVTRQYHEVWSDIMELWFLGMQALSALIPLMPWIAGFLTESGWPAVIVEALSVVSPNGIDENVKCSYQALLCPLVRISSNIGESLLSLDAVNVCKKHQLKELEDLLLLKQNEH